MVSDFALKETVGGLAIGGTVKRLARSKNKKEVAAIVPLSMIVLSFFCSFLVFIELQ